MGRPLYKIGQMIETKTEFGKVEEIRVKNSGTEYVLEGNESTVPEADVTGVYKKLEPRKARKATKTEKAPRARAA